MKFHIEALKTGFVVSEEIGRNNPAIVASGAFTSLSEAFDFIRSRMGPERNLRGSFHLRPEDADPEQPKPSEPAWKRAKVGDWVRVRACGVRQVVRIDPDNPIARICLASKTHDPKWWANELIEAIVPPPPEDDGA